MAPTVSRPRRMHAADSSPGSRRRCYCHDRDTKRRRGRRFRPPLQPALFDNEARISRLASWHGSHLAVGVGSVRREVFVGGLARRILRPLVADLPPLVVVVVAFEKSSHYVEATVVTGIAVVVLAFVVFFPVVDRSVFEGWAAGCEVDHATALPDTYTWTRAAGVRMMLITPFRPGAFDGCRCDRGSEGTRQVQYGTLGVVVGVGRILRYAHRFGGSVRPARAALAGDTGIGDSLPRSRPTFAAWLNFRSLLACSRPRLGARCWGSCSTGAGLPSLAL